MNYYLTQEQYEQLRAMSSDLLADIDTGEAYNKLLEQIGNQPASDLV